MSDYKIFLGYLATFIAIVAYIFYFRQIFLNKIRPHAFSWFFWGLLVSIAFAAQYNQHAGSGAWVTGITALACFVICVLALIKGDRIFTKIDWIFLIVAIVAIILWKLTQNPTLAVILVTLADMIGGMLPTLRKGYYKPYEESATQFTLSAIKWIPAIFALETYSVATWLYPASLIVTNSLIVIVILIRRKKLTDKSQTSFQI